MHYAKPVAAKIKRSNTYIRGKLQPIFDRIQQLRPNTITHTAEETATNVRQLQQVSPNTLPDIALKKTTTNM